MENENYHNGLYKVYIEFETGAKAEQVPLQLFLLLVFVQVRRTPSSGEPHVPEKPHLMNAPPLTDRSTSYAATQTPTITSPRFRKSDMHLHGSSQYTACICGYLHYTSGALWWPAIFKSGKGSAQASCQQACCSRSRRATGRCRGTQSFLLGWPAVN